jgi:hypothetical protein
VTTSADAGIDAGMCVESHPSTCTAMQTTVLASIDRDVYKFAVDDSDIYWADRGTRSIRRVPKAGGDTTIVVTLPDGPSVLALDKQTIYFRAANDIRFVPKAGGDPAILTSSVTDSTGLVVDDTNVYWPTLAGVASMPKKGGMGHLHMTMSAPRNASRTPTDGPFVYWSTYTAGIFRGPIDDDSSIMISDRRGYGLITDCDSIYFAGDACDGSFATGVYRGSKSSGTPVLLAGSKLADCSWQLGGLVEDADAIYWTEHIPGQGNVWRTPKSGGASALIASDAMPMDIAVDDRCVYWVRALDVGMSTARGEIVAAPIPR